MGSDQSRASGSTPADRPVDYYELLQVAEDATSEEIKVEDFGRPPDDVC